MSRNIEGRKTIMLYFSPNWGERLLFISVGEKYPRDDQGDIQGGMSIPL